MFIFYFIFYLFSSFYQFYLSFPSSLSSTSNPLLNYPTILPSQKHRRKERWNWRRERLDTRRPRTSSLLGFPNPSPSLTPPPSPCTSPSSESHSSEESERATMRGTTVRTRSGATLEVVLRLQGMMKCSSLTMVE